MNTRKDPYTGELFEPKRNNQIFANRKNQIAFNNENARKNRACTNLLDKGLKKNRFIISQLLNSEATLEVNKSLITSLGFDLSLFNRMLKKDGVNVYGIYEFYLMPIDSIKVEIGKI